STVKGDSAGLPHQTIGLLRAARHLYAELPADALVLITETPLDWDAVLFHLPGCRLFIAAQNRALAQRIKAHDKITLLDLEADPRPIEDRISLSLLKAVASGELQPGAHIVLLYNGIAAEPGRPEPIDSLSVIHLGEHLERLTASDLRRLNTQVPLDVLRTVVDLATEIGREGREGKPVGTMLVVGDTKRVLGMSRPLNFNPFRGYSAEERDVRDRRVREAIKDLAQLEGAILIGRDGIAVAACMYLDVPAEGITLSKGLGSRHWAAAAVSKKTQAIAVAVSQSSGTVRIFQAGEVVLHIEPLARPHIWQPFRLETREGDGEGDGLI
ncbi:MAG TPA: diadenylate cyclase, partial [Gemmataceae bacterium]|nr:diadenylate cyclase [Gemmataceae bacterium]